MCNRPSTVIPGQWVARKLDGEEMVIRRQPTTLREQASYF
jgi:hypothetical protein